jgi:ADP-ribosylglycohydrolase
MTIDRGFIMSNEQALARARVSLDGLSLGDTIGRLLGRHSSKSILDIRQSGKFPDKPWTFTDDTNMALSIYENLRLYGHIHQDELAKSFVLHFDRGRHYGPGARKFADSFREGLTWQEANSRLFNGGSFGNGGAMRIAPLGAYFADDLAKAVSEAKKATEITHAHPEGIAGGIAVAVATAIAWQHREKSLSRVDFIEQILPHIPKSDVRQNCLTAQALPNGLSIDEVVLKIGNGSKITAQDTVPYVLYCAGENLHDFENAFWMTASGGGDVDTTCAMVCGIVAVSVGGDKLPTEWLNRREPLPDWAFTS